MKDYQGEVISRTYQAVLLSRSACIECHDIDTLDTNSSIFRVPGFNANVKEGRPIIRLDVENETPSTSDRDIGVEA